MILQTPQQSLVKTRTDFRIEEFRKLIQQKGLNIEWQQTIECPCFMKSTTSLNLNLSAVNDIDANEAGSSSSCPVCEGKGFIRHSSQNIKAITTNAGGNEEVGKYGSYRKEKVKFTLEPEHLPSYGDRFIMKDSVIIYRDKIEISVFGSCTLSKTPETRNLTLVSGLTPVNILYMHRSDADGNAIVGGEIPVDDITLNGNVITFNNAANTPVIGSKLSIAYYINPSYVVINHPHSIRDTFVRTNQVEIPSPMPVQVECKMEIE
jgi:hypothetical protein